MSKGRWLPAGAEPEDFDTAAPPPGCLARMLKWGIYAFAAFGVFAAISSSGKPRAAQPTIAPTATIQPTNTPYIPPPPLMPPPPAGAIMTIFPTPTPKPATATIPPPPDFPTRTPGATATYAPPVGRAATWTPGAWVMTRYFATYDAQRGLNVTTTVEAEQTEAASATAEAEGN